MRCSHLPHLLGSMSHVITESIGYCNVTGRWLPLGVVTEFGRHLRCLVLGRFRSLRAFVSAAEPGRSEDADVAYLY